MTEIRRNGITEGVIWKQLLYFFFPILFGTFFQQFYNTVDAIIVGQVVGKQALAAVGVTTPFVNLLVGFFSGLASGTGVIISQHYGSRNGARLNRCVHTAMALSLLSGILFTVIGMGITPWVLSMMHTPGDIFQQSVDYLRVYFVGMIPTLLYNMGTAILRAVGDSKRPLYFLLAASALNIGLDLLFVITFQMGVAGAAWATVVSQILSAVLVIAALTHSGGEPYTLYLRSLTMDRSLLADISKIGFPAGLQSVMYSLSNLIIQAAINQFDTDVVAAWTVYGKMDSIFWLSISSMSLAVTTFAGQNFGAKKYDRIHKGLAVSMGMTSVITLLCCVLFLGFGRPLILLFNQDPAVVECCMEMIRYLVPCYFTYICIENFSGTLRGTGDSLFPTVLTCLGVCGLRMVCIFFLVPLRPTLNTVMFSYPLTWTITSLCLVVYYLRGNWLKRRIAATEEPSQEESLPVSP